MNNKIKYIVIAFLSTLLIACEEEAKRVHYPDSTPVIEKAEITGEDEANPTLIMFGDSILLTADVSDPLTPLSTLKVDIIVDDRLAAKEEIRTPGYSYSVNHKFKIPFFAYAEDGTDIEVYLTLTNVEGSTTQLSITNELKANRPTGFGNRLYFVMEDGTVYNANRQLGSQTTYQTPRVNIENPRVGFKIAEKLTADNQIDYSGFVWGNEDRQLTTIDEEGGFYEYNDPLIIKINYFTFDIYSFVFDVDAERLNPVTIDNKEFEAETLDGVDYLSISTALSQDSEVTFSGIEDLRRALNPDFFEYVSETKARFLGLSGTYKLLYNNATGCMYVEQTDKVFPDALWICGTGLGFAQQPYSTTTSWNWSKPEDYRFCRKIADGIFQVTVYADNFDIKFFWQRMWADDGGGEVDSSEYTITPSDLMKAGVNDEGKPNGNFLAGDNFTAGVYRIVINMNDKTIGIESVE